MTNDNSFDPDAWEDEINSPAFKHGVSVGDSLGRYAIEREAVAAYEAGEIALWVDMIKPKTMEGWDAWEAAHGGVDVDEFRKRWLDNDELDN